MSQTVSTEAENNSPKALIYAVDDEPIMIELIESLLRPAGYDVAGFGDGASAYGAFLQATPKPDLLLTDYLMSGMDGVRLIGACKAKKPNLKTILISGHVQGDLLDAKPLRPDLFLSKPFTCDQLLRAVRQLLFTVRDRN